MSAPVAIVILNWNGKHYLERFLPLLLQRTPKELAQIYVADNGSTDSSVAFMQQTYPQVPLMVFDHNHGYTGGYNLALSQIEAKYYLLLNSDIEVSPNWLEPLYEAMEAQPEVGICMPKILSWSHPNKFEYAGACGGFIDRFGFPFCRGRVLSAIENDYGQYNNAIPILWASGACLLIRSELFHRLEGFDNHFFAHMEEVDLCWRAHYAGAQVWVFPQSHVWHVGGGTLPNNSPHKLFLNYRNNLFMLHKNLPNRRLFLLLGFRIGMDLLSALFYLLQGNWSFSWAVCKAHAAFWRHRKELVRTPERTRGKLLPEIYRGSIIFAFFSTFRRISYQRLALWRKS